MKAICNTLFSLTLLASVSVLYCPKTLAMEDDQQGSIPTLGQIQALEANPAQINPGQPASHVQQEEKVDPAPAKIDPVYKDNEDEGEQAIARPENQKNQEAETDDKDGKKIGDGAKKDSKDGNKEADKALGKTKGFIPAVVGCALWPFKFTMKAVDWTANNARITSAFEGVGGLGLWKERFIGKWLKDHSIGLGRFVVIVALGSAGYYAWSKYQEWKKQNEEGEEIDFRAFFDDDSASFAEGAQQ